MSFLIIGPEQQTLIDAAVVAARAKPKPWEIMKTIVQDTPTAVLSLEDRKANVEKVLAEYPSQHLMLGTYRVAFSFEEQPAGLFRHVSVSSANPKALPRPQVMAMVCNAFGFSDQLVIMFYEERTMMFGPEKAPFRVWIEEFEPGRHAVNAIELVS